MSLTAADVAQIMRLVDESGFDEMSLEVDGLKLSFRRGSAAATAPAVAVAAPPAAAQPVTSTVAAVVRAPAPPGVREVVAPLLGTFYRSPKPGAAPFIDVGSSVDEDSIIGIIEVMKLMNTVRAGVRGTVTEVLARDGTLVEFGEALVRVHGEG